LPGGVNLRHEYAANAEKQTANHDNQPGTEAVVKGANGDSQGPTDNPGEGNGAGSNSSGPIEFVKHGLEEKAYREKHAPDAHIDDDAGDQDGIAIEKTGPGRYRQGFSFVHSFFWVSK
jgi:hypothetical protein